ncbi:MAG: isochorismatase family protein [Desulfuromonadaceae bacterium]
MESKAALLIVDVQNDFCPGGALQIQNGDRVVEPINRAIKYFAAARWPILASRDWHPAVTTHFRTFGGVWPVHCVQGTDGAAFHPGLILPEETVVLSKGINPELDGYSAFDAITGDGRILTNLLQDLEVRQLYISGLATDYCVLCTTLEALRSGLKVTILTDAVAGVDIIPGESACAIEDMVNAGAQMVTVAELPALLGLQHTRV